MALCIGLDIGTTNLAAVAFDSDGGRLRGCWSAPNRGRLDGTPGRAELDLAVTQRQVLDLLAQAAAELGDCHIAGIGVTGQQHGVGFLDADGTPVGPGITWQDQRAVHEPLPGGETALERYARLARRTLSFGPSSSPPPLGEGGGGGGSLGHPAELSRSSPPPLAGSQAGAPDPFYRLGCQPATGYLGPTLLWLQAMGQLPDVAGARACFIPDVAVAALIGSAPPCDPTDAGSSALFDIVSGVWDQALLSALDLCWSLLPPVVPTGTIVGELSPRAARATGLAAGTPVAVAMGDNQASYLGSVREPARSVLVNMGTGSQCSLLDDAFGRLDGVDTRWFPGGRYLYVGAGLFGGRSLAYLQGLFERVGRAFFQADAPPSLDAMVAEAAQVPPGADGLRCEPTFTGTRQDPAARGGYTGIAPANLTPGHLTRALLEGMAGAFATLYQGLAEALEPREQLVGAGNGIRRNRLLQTLLAEAFGLPLAVPAWGEEAAVGAAMSAAVGVGALPDWAAASALVSYSAPGVTTSSTTSKKGNASCG